MDKKILAFVKAHFMRQVFPRLSPPLITENAYPIPVPTDRWTESFKGPRGTRLQMGNPQPRDFYDVY